MTAPSSARPRSLDGSAVAVATSVMNVATYGFTMLAARIIGPSEFGALAACLGLLIVVQVGALGLQATAARRIAVDRDNVAAIEQSILSAVGPGVARRRPRHARAGARRQPGCSHLDDVLTAMILAGAVVPLTLAGGQAGVLQGERRWGALAVFYLASGIPRLVVGTRTDPLAPRRHERRPRGRSGLRLPGARRVVGAARASYARSGRAGALRPRHADGEREQRPGAVRLLRPVQRRHRHRAQRARRARRGALRSRPDHDQGDAVPARSSSWSSPSPTWRPPSGASRALVRSLRRHRRHRRARRRLPPSCCRAWR